MLAIAFVATSVLYMPVCDLVFDCGCSWPWASGIERCDIHVPGPPDCPICTSGVLVQAGFFALIGTPLLLAMRGAAAAASRQRLGPRPRPSR